MVSIIEVNNLHKKYGEELAVDYVTYVHAWFKILFCKVSLRVIMVVTEFESLEVLFNQLNLNHIKNVPASMGFHGVGMRTFIFKVKLKHDRRIWRMIEVLGCQTLHDLHGAIQEAYGFDDDHLYSYFMSGKAWDLSGYEYFHPDAAPQNEVEVRVREMAAKIRGRYPEPRLSATEVMVQSLGLKQKQRFLYLFDYGDEWLFEVEYVGEGVSEEVLYPRIVGFRGSFRDSTLSSLKNDTLR